VLGYYLIVLIGRNGPSGVAGGPAGISLIFTCRRGRAAAVVSFPLILKAARAASRRGSQSGERGAHPGPGRAAVLLR